jgi:hypothetical protein
MNARCYQGGALSDEGNSECMKDHETMFNNKTNRKDYCHE